ncbi:Peroxidase 52 [Trifolium repens]|nr:Peroxidase 52 [Trifolium repens]
MYTKVLRNPLVSTEHAVKANGIKTSKRTKTLQQSNIKPILSVLDHDGDWCFYTSFFHDCFVNGCDGSILLDDTATFTGEKNAAPNKNSARGFEVIDAIKSSVAASCSATVSCADILALATRDGIALLGGPSWILPLGRRDVRTASQSAANTQLPSPSSYLATLIKMFQNKGLTASDLTVLSGAHTIGQAECQIFRLEFTMKPILKKHVIIFTFLLIELIKTESQLSYVIILFISL